MKKKRLVCLVLACLSVLLLLCSCGDTVVLLTDSQKIESQKVSLAELRLAVEASNLEDLDFSISGAELEALIKKREECIDVLQSDRFVSKTLNAVRGKGIDISTERLRKMFSVETVDETVEIIAVRFSSPEYTGEQLSEIAKAFCEVAQREVKVRMLSINQLTTENPLGIIE